MALACKLYENDHEGRFPLHLIELEPDYLERGIVDSLRYYVLTDDGNLLKGNASLSGTAKFDWLYFGAGFDDKNPPSILLASPQIEFVGKRLFHKGEPRRILVRGDGSGFVSPENEYQKLLAETIRRSSDRTSGRQNEAPQHPTESIAR